MLLNNLTKKKQFFILLPLFNELIYIFKISYYCNSQVVKVAIALVIIVIHLHFSIIKITRIILLAKTVFQRLIGKELVEVRLYLLNTVSCSIQCQSLTLILHF